MIAQSQQTEAQYIERIRNERDRRDQMLKDPATSPLTSEQIQRFRKLEYFEIDPKSRITAQFSRSVNDTAPITMTDGSEQTFTKYGVATLSMDGKSYALDVFVGKNMPELADRPDHLFVAFLDDASGTGTSENGRYIAVEDRGGNTIEVDFNRAYNTFSVYNSRFISITAPQKSQKPPAHSIGQRKFEDR